MSVSQRIYAQPGYEIEILLTLEIVEENAFATLESDGISVIGGKKKALFKIGDLL
jgi:hypothetical protein